jgi:hypothetical protein
MQLPRYDDVSAGRARRAWDRKRLRDLSIGSNAPRCEGCGFMVEVTYVPGEVVIPRFCPQCAHDDGSEEGV